jgi:hypothetical protein
MSTLSDQMQINADADARLTAAFARHAEGRAVQRLPPGVTRRLALRMHSAAGRARSHDCGRSRVLAGPTYA